MLVAAYVLVLLVAWVGEVTMLTLIFSHPAASQPHSLLELQVKYGLIAALPIVAHMFICLAAFLSKAAPTVLFRHGFFMASIGVLSSVLAYRQFGDAAGGFLFIGYAAQWIIVFATVAALLRNKKESVSTRP